MIYEMTFFHDFSKVLDSFRVSFFTEYARAFKIIYVNMFIWSKIQFSSLNTIFSLSKSTFTVIYILFRSVLLMNIGLFVNGIIPVYRGKPNIMPHIISRFLMSLLIESRAIMCVKSCPPAFSIGKVMQSDRNSFRPKI